VVVSNQGVYASLARENWDVQLVVPSRWRNEYAPGVVPATAPGLEGKVASFPVVGRGRPQRHAYLVRTSRLLKRFEPDVLLIEEEPFSMAARQWAAGAGRIGLAFGVQVAETLDRPLPAPVRNSRAGVLARASFVVARSPRAMALAATWGASGVGVVPHSVAPQAARPTPEGPATAAFVGRLVSAKGLDVLLEAIQRLDGRVRLLVAGDGPLRSAVESAGANVTWLGPVAHEHIDEVYARAHVTCVPSRTTPTWAEQFGRVVVESLVRGVPVVASSSGELPWVLGLTGGGTLVAEGDPVALAEALEALTEDRAQGEALGLAGRDGALRAFSDDAAAAALAQQLAALSSRRAPR
jgi:glycosyltransferase involved in cell wall biosynthesis